MIDVAVAGLCGMVVDVLRAMVCLRFGGCLKVRSGDPVYAQGLSVGDGFFNMFRVEAREVQHCDVIRGLAVESGVEVSVLDGD
eukprot:g31446.t1